MVRGTRRDRTTMCSSSATDGSASASSTVPTGICREPTAIDASTTTTRTTHATSSQTNRQDTAPSHALGAYWVRYA